MMAGGSFASELEDRGVDWARGEAARRLSLMCPEAEISIIDAFATDWGGSEFTRGSYTYYGPDSSLDDVLAFHRAIDTRLVLAGEHTSVFYPGTIHGAYLSGLEAARRLVGCKEVGVP